MKKIIAVLVMALFILSLVPAALAEKGFAEEAKNKVKQVTDEKINQFKEDRQVAREQYNAQKEDLKETDKQYKSCREQNDSADCQDKKLELKNGVKQHLINTLALIDASLVRIQDRVEKTDTLTAEEKTTILAQIATLEEHLAADRAKAEALTDESTTEEVRTAVKDLKDTWNEVRVMERHVVAQMIHTKLSNLADKHLEYYNAMLARIEYLKQKGADTTELTKVAEQFKQVVDQMQADQDAADKLWAETKNDGITEKAQVEEAHQAQLVVREDMQKSKEVLKEFMSKYYELAKSVVQPQYTSETTEVSEDRERNASAAEA